VWATMLSFFSVEMGSSKLFCTDWAKLNPPDLLGGWDDRHAPPGPPIG
jgi:hypothetical protein